MVAEKPLMPSIGFSTFQEIIKRVRENPTLRESEEMELKVWGKELNIGYSQMQMFRGACRSFCLVSRKGGLIVKPDFCQFLDDFDYQKKAFKKLLDDGVFSSRDHMSRKQNSFVVRLKEWALWANGTRL